LARILLAFGERKKLSVAEMRRITGVSRNMAMRDIKILKNWDGLNSTATVKTVILR
jgi:predicted DNA-binding transcriptional regulator YafY